jgi:hypothetical protein
MPLINSTSTIARGKNIGKEMAAGKPKKQAIAIGYAVQRRAASKKSSPSKPKRAPTLDEVKAERANAK